MSEYSVDDEDDNETVKKLEFFWRKDKFVFDVGNDELQNKKINGI